MKTILEIGVKTRRIPLSYRSVQALRNLGRYDLVVFTSKNAREFFSQALRQYRIKSPMHRQIVQVGPRADLLRLSLRGRRILFPRSALAPYDIVKKMRARGAIVRVVQLYTAHGIAISTMQKKSLLGGKIQKLYFKSPSGIDGLLHQLPRSEHKIAFAIHAICIGETTAQAARKAGFKHVTIKNV